MFFVFMNCHFCVHMWWIFDVTMRCLGHHGVLYFAKVYCGCSNALYEYCCMGKTQPWKVCWAPLFVETQSMHTPLLSFSLFFLPNNVLVDLVMVSDTMFCTWHNVVMNVTKHTWQVWVWSWYACEKCRPTKQFQNLGIHF